MKFVELTAGLVKCRKLIWNGRSRKAPETPPIEVKKDGSVRLKSACRHVKLGGARAGAWQITVGFHDGNAASRCSSTMASFAAKKQSLVAK